MRIHIALAAAALLAGCLEGAPTDDDGITGSNDGGDAVTDAVTRIERGQFSGAEGPIERVIADQGAWEEFWRKHSSERSEIENAPTVDFATHRVIAVVLADRANACYSVEVANATTTGDTTTVRYVEYTPPPGMACAEVLTNPYDIVKIPMRDTDVQFRTEEKPLPGGDAGEGGAPNADPDHVGEESFERIERGQNSGVEGPVTRAIDNRDDWAAFWQEHKRNELPTPELPDVDFNTSRVVAVVLDDKSNTCWATTIDSVTTGADGTRVAYTVWTPPPDAVCGQAITQPFDLVKIPKRPTAVSFERSEEQGPPAEG